MRGLSQQLSKIRRARRRIQAHHRQSVRLTQLTFRFDGSDLPFVFDGLTAQEGYVEASKEILVDSVFSYGPLQVVFWALDNAAEPSIPELIRVANRLDCSTRLVLTGIDITKKHIQSFINAGLGEIWIMGGGLSNEVHQRNSYHPSELPEKVLALINELRPELANPIRVVYFVPLSNGVLGELNGLVSWADAVGFDEIKPFVPYYGEQSELSLLEYIERKPIRQLAGASNEVINLLNRIANHSNLPHRFQITAASLISTVVALPYRIESFLSQLPSPSHQRKQLVSKRTTGSSSNNAGWSNPSPLKCPIGTTRLSISIDGSVNHCPFQQPERINYLDYQETEMLEEVLSVLDVHRKRVLECDRICAHPELSFFSQH